jgi:hypothetical protein
MSCADGFYKFFALLMKKSNSNIQLAPLKLLNNFEIPSSIPL